MSRNSVVIVAAGKGTRMGSKVNKQFLEIKGKPILYYTIKAFFDSPLIENIYLVLSKDDMDYCKDNLLLKYNFIEKVTIVVGGAERQESVYNGLIAAENCDIVLIHDGARPFVDDEIIKRGIHYANLYGACACGVKPKDTVKVMNKEKFSVDTPNRDTLFLVQTPQCFKYDIIRNSHEKIMRENIAVTDDTMVVERYGYNVYLYEGSYKNIKITTPEDILIGETFL